MNKTFTTEVLGVTMLRDDKYEITLNRDQIIALYEDFTKALRIDVRDLRDFFFQTEGYMESDKVCAEYYKKNKDTFFKFITDRDSK